MRLQLGFALGAISFILGACTSTAPTTSPPTTRAPTTSAPSTTSQTATTSVPTPPAPKTTTPPALSTTPDLENGYLTVERGFVTWHGSDGTQALLVEGGPAASDIGGVAADNGGGFYVAGGGSIVHYAGVGAPAEAVAEHPSGTATTTSRLVSWRIGETISITHFGETDADFYSVVGNRTSVDPVPHDVVEGSALYSADDQGTLRATLASEGDAVRLRVVLDTGRALDFGTVLADFQVSSAAEPHVQIHDFYGSRVMMSRAKSSEALARTYLAVDLSCEDGVSCVQKSEGIRGDAALAGTGGFEKPYSDRWVPAPPAECFPAALLLRLEDQPGLPTPVAETRRMLGNAVATCDIGTLAFQAAAEDTDLIYGHSNPPGHLFVDNPPWITTPDLLGALGLPSGLSVGADGKDLWVWPDIAHLSEEDFEAMSAAEKGRIRETYGTAVGEEPPWTDPYVEIAPDGTWLTFGIWLS